MKRRQLIRDAYIESGRDKDKFEAAVKRRYIEGTYGFVGTLLVVLQLAWLLFQIWDRFNLDVPPEEPMEGEDDCEDVAEC